MKGMNIIMKRKCITFVLALVMTVGLGLTVNAAEEIPVIDDTKDFSTQGAPNYTYEDGYVIQSYDLTSEEIALGKALQELHTHPTIKRHFSVTAHSHSIKNIVNQSPKSYVWRPTEVWTRNDSYQNSGDWPTVAWSTGDYVTVSASVSTSVGVTDSIVSTSLGVDYTKGHTISTSTTRTFKVPYKKDGRVKISYKRPYKTFTCVTTYVVAGPPLTKWDETGSGSAIGKPYDIVCNLETKSY